MDERGGGRRRWGRRWWPVALGAVGVLVVAAVVGWGSARSSRDAPLGAAPDLTRPAEAPWVAGGVLHAGGATVPAVASDTALPAVERLAYAHGVTLASVRDADGRYRVVRMADGEVDVLASRRPRPREIFAWDLALSPDGDLAVFVEGDAAGRWTLRSLDYSEEPEGHLERLRSPTEVIPVAVLADDRVVVSTHVVHSDYDDGIWTPGAADVVPLRDLRVELDSGMDPWPLGLSGARPGSDYTIEGGGTPHGVFGTVSADGRFERVGRTGVAYAGTWSADGRTFVAPGDDYDSRDLRVQQLVGDRLGDPRPLPLPEPLTAVVGWESRTALLVMVGPDEWVPPREMRTARQVRCDVVVLACDYTRDPPPPGRWYR